MNWKQKAEAWLNFAGLDADLKSQLQALTDKELEDAFHKDLEFGTGGMRGEIGPGTNRMNIYTVRKASSGLAAYIKDAGKEAMKRGVVIAYDCRHKSREFAMEAAKTLATRGIQTYVFEDLRPTPVLSFAVRHLNAFSGIVITASHNPPEYNGYKVYGPDGGQLVPEEADKVIEKVSQTESELSIEVCPEEELKNKGLIQIIGEEVDEAYLQKLVIISENRDLKNKDDIKIVFTPLHGTANKFVRKGLEALQYKNVYVVKEQEQPDPDFSTVKSPNPEEHAAFELAIRYGRDVDADLLIGTDPDADRLGIAVKNERGEYQVLTGNQTGALLLHYLLSQKQKKGTLPQNGVMLKTIVTSDLGKEIASSFGVETVEVLTGFKFIAEKIQEYHTSGKYQFLFGYEESYGYLIGDFARDKDAVQAAVLAAEMCAYYKEQGMSLYDALLKLFDEYGYFLEGLRSLTLKGLEGAEKIQAILSSYRKVPLERLLDLSVVIREDYLQGKRTITGNGNKEETIQLPKSNVIKYYFDDGSWVCLRPSGTEPKIKFYFGVKGNSLEDSRERLAALEKAFMNDVDLRMNKN